MALSPTAVDVQRVYTSLALVQRYVPAAAIAGSADTTPGPGKVLRTDLTDIIFRYSRLFDDIASAKGFETPFPDISATNPSTPQRCVMEVTQAVVGDVRAICGFGNRKTGAITQYYDEAAKSMAALLENPKSIGYGRVSSDGTHLPEPLDRRLFANLYQFHNRNILADSIRFVDEDGNQVRHPDGRPFSLAYADYDVHNAAEGLVYLWNEAAILSAVGVNGGVVYDFSWHKLDWGQSHPTPMPGERYSP